MELSTRAIVLIVILVMLAVVLASFFIFQSGQEISKAEAKRIFEERCIDYGKRECSWDVTEQAGFNQFVTSCKVLYGQEREAFSCLYSLCGQCKGFELEQLRCSRMCEQVNGMGRNKVSDITPLCEDYRTDAECSRVACGVCA